MSWRSVIAAALLLVVWACFAFAVAAWLKSEQERCSRLEGLSAECFAPQALAAWVVSIVFVLASGILLWLALRR